jgi:protein transport protein SEC61 subunit gamma-like protein
VQREGLIDRAWNLQHRVEDRIQHLGKGKYGRILKMARKPTEQEFYKTSKITFLGILIIGLVGFLIYILKEIVAPWILSAFT